MASRSWGSAFYYQSYKYLPQTSHRWSQSYVYRTESCQQVMSVALSSELVVLSIVH